jgi:hypothetical protein
MSLRSEEKQLRGKHRKALRQRRNQIEKEHLSLAARLGVKARRLAQKIQSVHKRRVGTFKVSMLDGHPANINDACKRLVALAYKFADERNYVCTVTATTDGTHAPGSWHNPTPLGRAVDLIFATVEQMEEFQHFCLTHTKGDAEDFNELFGPAGFYVKNGDVVRAHFPDHRDHNHVAPRDSYRR